METKYIKGNTYFTKQTIKDNKTKEKYNKEKNLKIKQYPYLDEDIETEVAIIGGGVTGAILAYYFSKNNISNILLEKSRIGHGSTSVSTALLQYELDDMVNELEQIMKKQNIVKAYRLGQKALAELEKFIKEYGNKCEYTKVDSFLYSAKKDDKKILEYEYNFRKENKFDVEFIDESQKIFPFEVQAGIISKNGGSKINPYLLTHHLLNVAKNNTLVYENTELEDIEYKENIVNVKTSYGNNIKCKKVIIATGYDIDKFTKRNFGTKSITYNIVTEDIGENKLDDKYIIRDIKDPYNYIRTTKDNRYIIGGEDMEVNEKNYSEEISNEKYNILEQRLKNMFPHARNSKIAYKYAGIFCSTKDNLGFIGEDKTHKNLWYSLGYGANGILYAMLAGDMLSKLYKGEFDSNINLFKVDRFDGNEIKGR